MSQFDSAEQVDAADDAQQKTAEMFKQVEEFLSNSDGISLEPGSPTRFFSSNGVPTDSLLTSREPVIGITVMETGEAHLAVFPNGRAANDRQAPELLVVVSRTTDGPTLREVRHFFEPAKGWSEKPTASVVREINRDEDTATITASAGGQWQSVTFKNGVPSRVELVNSNGALFCHFDAAGKISAIDLNNERLPIEEGGAYLLALQQTVDMVATENGFPAPPQVLFSENYEGPAAYSAAAATDDTLMPIAAEVGRDSSPDTLAAANHGLPPGRLAAFDAGDQASTAVSTGSDNATSANSATALGEATANDGTSPVSVLMGSELPSAPAVALPDGAVGLNSGDGAGDVPAMPGVNPAFQNDGSYERCSGYYAAKMANPGLFEVLRHNDPNDPIPHIAEPGHAAEAWLNATDDAGRQAAIKWLKELILDKNNTDAPRIMKALLLTDAIQRLKSSPEGSQAQMDALIDLALIEEGDKQGGRSLLNSLYPAHDATRQQRIDEARNQAKQIGEKPDDVVAASTRMLAMPGISAADKQAALKQLERVANFHVSNNGQGDQRTVAAGYESAYNWTRDLQDALSFRAELRNFMANPAGGQLDYAGGLMSILAQPNSHSERFLMSMLSNQAGAQELLDVVRRGDKQQLELYMKSEAFSENLKLIVQNFVKADLLTGILAAGNTPESKWLKSELSKTESGKLLVNLIEARLKEESGRRSDSELLTINIQIAQTLANWKDAPGPAQLVSELRTVYAARQVLLEKDNPTRVAIVAELQKTPAGQEFLQELRNANGDVTKCIEALRDPAKLSKILKALSVLENEAAFIAGQLQPGFTAGAVLEQFKNPAAVERARAEARKFSQENWKAADQALNDGLQRKDPPGQCRADSIKKLDALADVRLEKMGVDQLGPTCRWAKANHFALSIYEAKTPAEMAAALESLKSQAFEKGNFDAPKLLKAYGRAEDIDNLIAKLRSTDAQTSATTAETVRHIAELGYKTRPQELSQCLEWLAGAAEKGDPIALAFLRDNFYAPTVAEQIAMVRNWSGELCCEEEKTYERFRKVIPSAADEMDDLRTRRILQDVGPQSSPADYQRAIDRLREESEKHDNHSAKEWLQWAEVTQQFSAINKAAEGADPATTVRDAVNKLKELAEKGNPHARAALAALVVADANEKRVLDLYAMGNAKLGEDKPLFLPDVSKLPESVRTQLKLEAFAAFEQRLQADSAPVTRQEASMLALVYVEATNDPDSGLKNPRADGKELNDRIADLFRKQIDSAGASRPLVMEGIFDIIRTDKEGTKGSAELADIYVRGAKDPVFAKHFDQFSRWAWTGHEPSLRIVAAATSGVCPDESVRQVALRTIEGFGSQPGQADRVRDLLIHSYKQNGDQFALLETLGKLSHANGNLSNAARAALRDGLKAWEKPNLSEDERKLLHTSALRGMLLVPDKWQKEDAVLISAKLTPETIDGLMRVADKVPTRPENVQGAFVHEFMQKIKLTEGKQAAPEVIEALRALRAFPNAISVEDVNALVRFAKTDMKNFAGDPELAKKIDHQVALTLISVMTRGDGLAQDAAYQALGPNYEWQGLSKQGMREALIAYAKGRPMDLDVSKEVSLLVYDAGIPRPTAGLFKDIGIFGTDAEQFELAEEAIRKVSERTKMSRSEAEAYIRELIVEAQTYNSLPDSLKARIGNGLPVDLKMLIGQITNGTIFDGDCPNNFLHTKNIQNEIQALKNEQNARIADLNNKHKQAENERQDLLRELGEQTKQGTSTLDDIGHGFLKVVSFGQAETDVDRYEALQSERVQQIRALEARMGGLQHAKGEPSSQVTFYSLAQELDDWTRLMQQGKIKQADFAAAQMWGKYGDQLQNHAPDLWFELTREGDRPIDRNVFKRLTYNGFGQRQEMPVLNAGSNGPPSGLEQGIDVLRDLKPGMVDTIPIRNQALQAIDSDPAIAKLVTSSGVFANDMTALFGSENPKITGMFEAGLEGTKYETFTDDVRRRANRIKEAIDSISQDDIYRVKDKIRQLQAAEQAAQARGDYGTARELSTRVKNLQDVVKIFDRNSEQRAQIERMISTINSPQFDANTFLNWLKNDGLVFAIAIAAAVATVMTMGAASPLLVAAAASGAALIASEGTKEILFQADIGLGRGDQSRIGAFLTGKPEIDPVTGRERPREFCQDVLKPYAKQWAMDTVICLATMGLGKIASKGIEALGSRATHFVARYSPRVARMQTSVKQISSKTATDAAKASSTKKFLAEFADESADEFKENITEDLLAKAVGKSDQVLGFLAATLVATKKGVSFNRIKGTNVVALDCLTKDMPEVIRGYETAGAKVSKRADGCIEVKVDGRVFVVGPKEIIERTLPAAEVKQVGEPSTIQKSQTLDQNKTAADLTAKETQRLGDAEWSPTDSSVAARKDLQKSVMDLKSGDYQRAIQTIDQSTVGTAPGKISQTLVDVKIDATALLSDPVKLQEYLSKMQYAGEVRPHPDNAAKGPAERSFEMKLPRPIVTLAANVEVDLRNPTQVIGPPPRALTDQEKQIIDRVMAGPGKRILQEQALIMMEEKLVHLAQLQTGGQVISPTYAKFLAETGKAPDGTTNGDGYYQALRSGKPGSVGRSSVTYEQELIALLYDSGMPLADIELHFGKQHGEQRKPIFDYLKKVDSGQAPGVRPGGDAPLAPVQPGAQPVLRRTDGYDNAVRDLKSIEDLPGIDHTKVEELSRLLADKYQLAAAPKVITDTIAEIAKNRMSPAQANAALADCIAKINSPHLLDPGQAGRKLLDESARNRDDSLNADNPRNKNAQALRTLYQQKLDSGELSPAQLQKLLNLDSVDRSDIESMLLKNKLSPSGLANLLALDNATISSLMAADGQVSPALFSALDHGLLGPSQLTAIMRLPLDQQKIAAQFLDLAAKDSAHCLDRSSVTEFLQLSAADQTAILHALKPKGGATAISTADLQAILAIPHRTAGNQNVSDAGTLVAALSSRTLTRTQIDEFSAMTNDQRAGMVIMLKSGMLPADAVGPMMDCIRRGEITPKQANELSMTGNLRWATPADITALLRLDRPVREAVLDRISEMMSKPEYGDSTFLSKTMTQLQPLGDLLKKGVITEATLKQLAVVQATDAITNVFLKDQAAKAPADRVSPEAIQHFVEHCRNGRIAPDMMEVYRKELQAGRLSPKVFGEMMQLPQDVRQSCEQFLRHKPETFKNLSHQGKYAELHARHAEVPDPVRSTFPDMSPDGGKYDFSPRADLSGETQVVQEYSKMIDLMNKGDYVGALNVMESHVVVGKDQFTTNPEVKWTEGPRIQLADLNNPATLQSTLDFMKKQGNANQYLKDPTTGDKVISIADPVIVLPGGQQFKLRDASQIYDGGNWRRTTAQERQLIESIQQSPAGKAINGKTAMILAEEWGHTQQQGAGGISKLTNDFESSPQYAQLKKYWADKVPADQLNDTVRRAMREIDIAAGLIDAGLSLDAVKKLLGDQHLEGERSFFYDYVAKRAAGRTLSGERPAVRSNSDASLPAVDPRVDLPAGEIVRPMHPDRGDSVLTGYHRAAPVVLKRQGADGSPEYIRGYGIAAGDGGAIVVRFAENPVDMASAPKLPFVKDNNCVELSSYGDTQYYYDKKECVVLKVTKTASGLVAQRIDADVTPVSKDSLEAKPPVLQAAVRQEHSLTVTVAGQSFDLAGGGKRTITIGSGPRCDVVMPGGNTVGAVFRTDGKGFFIQSAGSNVVVEHADGTKTTVDSKALALRAGDKVTIDGQTFDLRPGVTPRFSVLPVKSSGTNHVAKPPVDMATTNEVGPIEPGFTYCENIPGDAVPTRIFDPRLDPVLAEIEADATKRFAHLKDNPQALMQAINQYVHERMTPTVYDAGGYRPGASQAPGMDRVAGVVDKGAGGPMMIGDLISRRNGVCLDQAMLSSYLAQRMGLKTDVVTGALNGQPHAWVRLTTPAGPLVFDPRNNNVLDSSQRRGIPENQAGDYKPYGVDNPRQVGSERLTGGELKVVKGTTQVEVPAGLDKVQKIILKDKSSATVLGPAEVAGYGPTTEINVGTEAHAVSGVELNLKDGHATICGDSSVAIRGWGSVEIKGSKVATEINVPEGQTLKVYIREGMPNVKISPESKGKVEFVLTTETGAQLQVDYLRALAAIDGIADAGYRDYVKGIMEEASPFVRRALLQELPNIIDANKTDPDQMIQRMESIRGALDQIESLSGADFKDLEQTLKAIATAHPEFNNPSFGRMLDQLLTDRIQSDPRLLQSSNADALVKMGKTLNDLGLPANAKMKEAINKRINSLLDSNQPLDPAQRESLQALATSFKLPDRTASRIRDYKPKPTSAGMEIVNMDVLEKFMQDHARSEPSLKEFIDNVQKNKFKDPHDVLNTFGSADQIGDGLWVFDIAGNNYRVVATVDYQTGQLVILRAGTHAEYDRWKLK